MDVCKTTTDAASASYCEEIKKSFECTGPCPSMAITPSAEAVRVLAPGLNKLYGTPCTGLGLMSSALAQSQTDNRFTSLFSIGVLVLLQRMVSHM